MSVRTFTGANMISKLISEEHVAEALKKMFQRPFQVQKAPQDDNQHRGIDFYAASGDFKISIDLKVRRNQNRNIYLIVETEWLDGRKKAWLHASKADYFLFAHIFDDRIVFFLLRSDDLREFCNHVKPLKEEKYADNDGTVAVLRFYEYKQFADFSKNLRQAILAYA